MNSDYDQGYLYSLPMSLNVGGVDYEIRTDFRAILDILAAFNDADFDDADKNQALIEILYVDYEDIPVDYLVEAALKASDFIDAGSRRESKPKPRTIDWVQDAPIIIPAINKASGKEIRAEKYMHWWTFYGYYMEIGEGLLSQIIGIRQKKAKGKPLEKWENEFFIENKDLCLLKTQYNEKQRDDIDRLNKLFR